MDASTLKVVSTAPIHVKNAAGEPLYEGDKPVRIIVQGPGSRAYGVVEARRTARTLRRLNDNDGKMTAPSAEEALSDLAEDLATVTVAFEQLSFGDKQGIELFEAFYRQPELGYITRQVQKHIGDWANFLPKPAVS